MNTIFMNSKNNKTSNRHRLLLNVADKTNLKRSDEYVASLNLSIWYVRKNIKRPYKKTMHLRYQLQRGMNSSNYLMGQILSYIKYSRLF